MLLRCMVGYMRIFLFMILCFSFVMPAHAMKIVPSILDLRSLGPDSQREIQVTNTSNKHVPVEITLEELDITIDGSQMRTPVTEDDILIFPPQSIIPAGRTQTFRLKWIGDPFLQSSRTYSIVLSQIPVTIPDDYDPFVSISELKRAHDKKREEELAAKGAATALSLDVVFNFVTAVTVAPAEYGVESKNKEFSSISPPDVSVLSSSYKVTDDGGKFIEVVLRNSGDVHTYLSNVGSINFFADNGWKRSFSGENIAFSIGAGLLLPKHDRRFMFPVPELESSPGDVSVTFGF